MKLQNVKLIIGLGNPGRAYEKTYHNVGFLAVDYLTRNHPISNFKFLISNVFMNQSGGFVVKTLKKSGVKPAKLMIVHDDSDIELGKYKISFGRGSAGHKGVESIIKSLGTENFWRLRIGIRPKVSSSKFQVSRKRAGEFVLKKISKKDMEILEKVFEEATSKIKPLSS